MSTPLGTQRQSTLPPQYAHTYAHTRPPILSATREQAPGRGPSQRVRAAARLTCMLLPGPTILLCLSSRSLSPSTRACSVWAAEGQPTPPKSSLRNRAQVSAEGPQAPHEERDSASIVANRRICRQTYQAGGRAFEPAAPALRLPWPICCPVGREQSFAWTNRGPPANTKYLQ